MKKIIFLGDSITDAGHLWEHPPLGLGYVRLLSGPLSSRCPDIRILNKGQDGFTAARVLQTLAENCLNYSPDAASLLIGINDVAAAQNTGLSLKAAGFCESISGILETLKHAGIPRIFCAGPFLFPSPAEYLNWFPTVQEAEDIFQTEALRLGLPFLSLHERFNQAVLCRPVSELSPDGVHLTHKGHELLAKWWAETFLNALRDGCHT